jgi:hypothetical protein
MPRLKIDGTLGIVSRVKCSYAKVSSRQRSVVLEHFDVSLDLHIARGIG